MSRSEKWSVLCRFVWIEVVCLVFLFRDNLRRSRVGWFQILFCNFHAGRDFALPRPTDQPLHTVRVELLEDDFESARLDQRLRHEVVGPFTTHLLHIDALFRLPVMQKLVFVKQRF